MDAGGVERLSFNVERRGMENKYSGMLAWEEGISYLCVAETKDKMQIDMNELQDNYNPLAIPSEFVSDVHSIIERGRQQAYASVGQISIVTFWNVGRRIVEEEQRGETRAAYGADGSCPRNLRSPPSMPSSVWR